MAARNYSNIAVPTTLAAGIGSGDTSLTVNDATGWPAAPFILVIDAGTANEELVLVGGKSGAIFSSLTRGYGGTSGVAHSGGDAVEHVISADDISFLWTHVHSGSGGDDSAQIPHSALTSVGSDDHHAQDHEARHRSGGADELSHTNLAGLAGDDHTQYLNSTRHDNVHSNGIRARRATSVQSIPDDTGTTVIYNSLEYEDDPNSDFPLNTGTGVITVASAGWYLITAGIVWETDTTGSRRLVIVAGGVSVATQSVDAFTFSALGQGPDLNASTIVKLSASDTIYVQAHQDSGGPEDVLADQHTFIAVHKLD